MSIRCMGAEGICLVYAARRESQVQSGVVLFASERFAALFGIPPREGGGK